VQRIQEVTEIRCPFSLSEFRIK